MAEVLAVMTVLALFGYLGNQPEAELITKHLLSWSEQRFYRWFARKYPHSFRFLLTELVGRFNDAYNELAEEERLAAVNQYLAGQPNDVITARCLELTEEELLGKMVRLAASLRQAQNTEAEYVVVHEDPRSFVFRQLPTGQWEIWYAAPFRAYDRWGYYQRTLQAETLQRYLDRFTADTDVESEED
jgi:hypothetical protein